MRKNPVYHKELRMTLRSPKLIISMMCFNVLLALTGIMCISTLDGKSGIFLDAAGWLLEYSGILQRSGENSYNALLALYALIAMMEWLLLIILIPSITSGMLAGERESQTLDLMLTTQLEPFTIVFGKLQAALNVIFTILFSTLPVTFLVFAFGGLRIHALIYLMAVLLVIAVYMGSIGIFFSVVLKRTMTATMASFAAIFAVTVGSVLIVQIFVSLADYGVLEATEGFLSVVLLLNPLITFLNFLQLQIGNPSAFSAYAEEYYHIPHTSFVAENWLIMSLAIQLIVALLLMYWAGTFLRPKYKS